jgi:hypothetical protein
MLRQGATEQGGTRRLLQMQILQKARWDRGLLLAEGAKQPCIRRCGCRAGSSPAVTHAAVGTATHGEAVTEAWAATNQ